MKDKTIIRQTAIAVNPVFWYETSNITMKKYLKIADQLEKIHAYRRALKPYDRGRLSEIYTTKLLYDRVFGGVKSFYDIRPKYKKYVTPFQKHLDLFSSNRRLREILNSNPEINFLDSIGASIEEMETVEKIEANLEINLPLLLESYNLENLWNGANYALQTPLNENPDKIRHVLISLRSIIEHILRKLLPPSKEIINWKRYEELIKINKPDNQNGIPRKIQIMYYCEKIDFGFIEDFTYKEVKYIDEVFKKLSKIHEYKLELTDNELMLLKIRAGTVIWLLLMIHEIISKEKQDNP